jgi:hypothetical protein
VLGVVLACAPYSFPGFHDSQWLRIFLCVQHFQPLGIRTKFSQINAQIDINWTGVLNKFGPTANFSLGT